MSNDTRKSNSQMVTKGIDNDKNIKVQELSIVVENN